MESNKIYSNNEIRKLLHNQLDDFTYNKALQKIVESRKVDKETKEMIKSRKRV